MIASLSDEYADPEDRDEYLAENIFFVPEEARWAKLQQSAKSPEIGVLIDRAMAAIERDNPSLKGVLPQDYGRENLDKRRFGELIDLIGTISVGDKRKPLAGHPGPGLRILPRTIRQRGRQERRAVLHAQIGCAGAGGDARTVSRDGCMTPAVAAAGCSSSRKNSSRSTAAMWATSPSTGRKATRPRGGCAR